MRTRITLPTLLAALVFMGVGCISFSTDGAGTGNGGIFRSSDKGDSWVQRVAIPTVDGSTRTIGSASVITIVQDPNDAATLYIGTLEHGLWYSYDAGASWHQPAAIRRGRVSSIAVHPREKCTVYATIENRILKSTDCSRTYEATYLDTRTARVMTAVAVDAFNPNIVWIGNDGGDVLRSTDSGASWQLVTTFRSPVKRLAFMADDSRRLYAATDRAGVFRTDNAGGDWLELLPRYRQFRDSAEFYDLAVGVSDPALIIIATKHGLLASRDRGDTWAALELLTPASSAAIHSVAIDPRNADAIYYGTATTFYRSPNGGVNWVPKRLPTTRAATSLLVDRTNSDVLTMGVTLFN